MNIPEKERYEYVNRKVFEFILENQIHTFPIDPFEIINKNNWKLIPYSELVEETGVNIDTIIQKFGNDGLTTFQSGTYYITYNDCIKPQNRILFTLMHEIGHIYLNHLEDFDQTTVYRNDLSECEYQTLEREANAFARNVMVPVNSLHHAPKDKNSLKRFLMSKFSITDKCADTRIALLPADNYHNKSIGIDLYLKKIFKDVITNSICNCCGYTNFEHYTHCPMCGKTNFENGLSYVVYADNIPVNEQGKALQCPSCRNTDIMPEANFCHICGTYLYNQCDDRSHKNGASLISSPCGEKLPSNARFCIHCGSTSTFYNDKILTPWEVEYNDFMEK